MEADEPQLALDNALRALGLSVQLYGFDSAQALTLHISLTQIYLSKKDVENAVKHLKASAFLSELLGGSNQIELFTSLYRLANLYAADKENMERQQIAYKIFKKLLKMDNQDRMVQAVSAYHYSMNLSALKQYKESLEQLKFASRFFRLFAGEDSQLYKDSAGFLQQLEKTAAEHGNKQVEQFHLAEEAAKAEAIARDLILEEERAQKKNKKNKKAKK